MRLMTAVPVRRISLRSVWDVSKYVLTPVLVWFVFRNVPFKGMLENLGSVHWGWFLLTLLFYLVQQVLFVLRWQMLLVFNRIVLPFWQSMKIHLISSLFQMFLPSGFGGDAAKFAFTFGKAGKVEALNSVLIARLSGMFVLALFALAGGLAYAGPYADLIRVSAVLFFLLFVAGILFLVFLLPRVSRWRLFRTGKVFPKVLKILNGLRRNLDGRNVLKLFLVSVVLQASTIIPYFCLFESLGLHLGFFKVLIALPAITFTTMIVPSISGVGTREVFTWFFFAAELGTKQMLGSLAILNYSLYVVVSLAGLAFWIESLMRRDPTGGKKETARG
jgi:uncharacterized membrane protein YbhN (UPF0104 family)